ncbi:Fructose-1 [Diplonema papillatum]|nr:Fructose-1 [Diplonema papillatum]
MPLDYLRLLSEMFPTKQAAATELVNLETVVNMPKGTEHFLSDVHGEYEAFRHVLRSCSGVVKRHITEIFPSGKTDESEPVMTEREQEDLATLIYYPRQVIDKACQTQRDAREAKAWLRTRIVQLVAVLQSVCSKYTKKYVLKAVPEDYLYMVSELLNFWVATNDSNTWTAVRVQSNREHYFDRVVQSIVDAGRGPEMVVVLADLVCRLAVDHLHIVGDIFDRGPAAHDIMEDICSYHSVDVQWGNHDVLWMGAAAGSEACMCCCVRIALRYSNMTTLEDAYGIAMLPLSQLAMHYYSKDEKAATIFKPKKSSEKVRTEADYVLLAKMQKAIAVIQFKVEGQLIKRNPEFGMDDRLMLHTLNREQGTITINGKTYKLNDSFFPTIDPADPLKLTDLERACVDQLLASFTNSRWLQKHMACLWRHGSMYTVYNGNLLLHGAIPMKDNGSLEGCLLDGNYLVGKEYCDALEAKVRQGVTYPEGSKARLEGLDMLYYLWTGPKSPLFGKGRMTTFERYFIDDKRTHTEPKDPYLKQRHDAKLCKVVLKEFGCDPETGIIINGHTPVKVAKGESPIKADGRLIVIDGGFSKAYQKETGIAGYTLISNSYGMLLAEHMPFRGIKEAVSSNADNHAKTIIVRHNTKRIRIADTDKGRPMLQRIYELRELIDAYETGALKENPNSSKL